MIECFETYHSSSKFNPISVPLMLGAGAVLGVAAAYLTHFVARYTGYNLLPLFLILIIVATGLGLWIGINIGKCRNKIIGAVAGLLISSLSYVSIFFFDSRYYYHPDLLTYLNRIADDGYTILWFEIWELGHRLSWEPDWVSLQVSAPWLLGGSAANSFARTANAGWVNTYRSMFPAVQPMMRSPFCTTKILGV